MANSIVSIIEKAGAIPKPYSNENTQKMCEFLLEFRQMISENDENGIDALKGSRGETILQKLCSKSLYEFVKVLFEAGTCEANARRANEVTSDTDFEYPLLTAGINGDVETLKLLLDNGANIAPTISENNETILHCILKGRNGDSEKNKQWQECLNLLLGSAPLDDKVEDNRKSQITDIVNKC